MKTELFLRQPANTMVLSQLTLVPLTPCQIRLFFQCQSLYYWLLFCSFTLVQFKAKLSLLVLQTTEDDRKQKTGSMSAGGRGGGDRMSCGMWCFGLVGQSEVMLYSNLPGFSGASVTFSWTSLGITKIEPNRPVNVRLLITQLNIIKRRKHP